MNNIYGNVRRLWLDAKPDKVYDPTLKEVFLDVQPDTKKDTDGNTVNGYSAFKITVDGVMDYGHIKSQLIEAAYPQKEEFARLNNAESDIIDCLLGTKKAADCSTFTEFKEFDEWRTLCATTAKSVINGE